MVTWLFLNFAVSRDAARRAGLSATAELLVILLALHPPAYGAGSHLAPTALDPLRLLAASSEFSDGAHHLFAAAYRRQAQGERVGSSGAR